MHIHVLLHAVFEGPGIIRRWAALRGHTFATSHVYAGEPLPSLAAIDWLVVMGGPMNVVDEQAYPWLRSEKWMIEQAIAHNKTVIGVCLGAQLIAHVLGAPVYRNVYKEIGWFPVTLTPTAQQSHPFAEWPSSLMVFHWHSDTFALPHGAQHIAESAACRYQAFAYGTNIIGLQFHPEVARTDVAALIEHCTGDLPHGAFVQAPHVMLATPGRFAHANAACVQLLDRLAPPAAINGNELV